MGYFPMQMNNARDVCAALEDAIRRERTGPKGASRAEKATARGNDASGRQTAARGGAGYS